MTRKPNLLIIQSDQHLGSVMGCAGHPLVQTPNLDRLAAAGTRFANAVANAPVCTPSRGIIQTGVYWFRHGAYRNNQPLSSEFPTMAELFARCGYSTSYIGKWHLDGRNAGAIPPERRHGWQEWHGYGRGLGHLQAYRFTAAGERVLVPDCQWAPSYHTDLALDFMRRRETAQQPWLQYVAYEPPHPPQDCLKQFLQLYPAAAVALTAAQQEAATTADDRQRLRDLLQSYYGLVSAVDHEVGRLLDGLHQCGAARNTVVVYLSDHGDLLGQHQAKPQAGDQPAKFHGKGRPSVNVIRIPMIFFGPDRIIAGQVCDTVTSTIDLLPTILDLAEIEAPSHLQGQSLAAWCRTGTGDRNPAAYLGLGVGPQSWRGVWDGRYLYGQQQRVLYDSLTDPEERRNLYHENPRLRQEFDNLVTTFAAAAGDQDYAHADTSKGGFGGWLAKVRRLLRRSSGN